MLVEDFCSIIFGEACFNSLDRPTTYCSDFVSIVAASQDNKDFANCIYANDIITVMRNRRDRWLEVDATAAQKAANLGVLVIAGWESNVAGAGGHVCVIIPGTVGRSSTHNKMMPMVCNVGQHNFYGKHAGFSFLKDHPPRYWLCAV